MAKRQAAIGLVCLAIGAGGGAAAQHSYSEASAEAERRSEAVFVEVRRMPLPLITPDGYLVRYGAIDFALETVADDRAALRRRLPEIRHRINLAAHRTPLAAGDDGRVEVEELRKLVAEAARGGDILVKDVRILTVQQI